MAKIIAENAGEMAKIIAENAGEMAKIIAENADYYLKSYWNVVCYINTYKLSRLNGIKTGVMANVPNKAILLQEAYQFKGQLAENFFLEQIIGKFEGEPFYFSDQSSREIDFLLQVDSDIIPIEIKSGSNVKAISLKNYLAKRHPRFAIRFSENNFSRTDNLLNMPLYMAARLHEFL